MKSPSPLWAKSETLRHAINDHRRQDGLPDVGNGCNGLPDSDTPRCQGFAQFLTVHR
jgi:hypothetical protein